MIYYFIYIIKNKLLLLFQYKRKEKVFFFAQNFFWFFFSKTLTYRCDDAICDALELCLAFADVGGETSTSEIERIADGVGDGAGETTAEQFGGRRLPELRLRVVVREHVVDEIVERQRRTLLRRIARADLTRLPRQKASMPCSACTRRKQSKMLV